MDFTASKYKELLLSVRAAGMPVYGIRDWMEQQPGRGVFIRHDVDRLPKNSLHIARLEHELGLATTYYFRIVPASYDPRIIEEIAGLGHEIGYHYEDLSLAGGNPDEAVRLFGKHLDELRALADIRTAAMHGRPLSKYDNRDLWKHCHVKDFGLVGEAFLDIDYSDVYYFTDTGRSWDMHKHNLRDKTDCRPVAAPIADTDALAQFMTDRPNEKFALITHPERWSANYWQWTVQLAKDYAINQAKWLIGKLRPAPSTKQAS